PGASVERVYRPSNLDELAQIVAEHHARSEALLVCGGRTRLAQANRAEKLVAAISLEGFAGIDVFEPDEGVVHAKAGTPIRALREAVAAEGWELPLDPPGPATTVGGTIASAAVGPRGQAFGRVADAVLGLELVGADGTSSKCGGRVVKNVTGYDLAKLYTGSFGSLAVVTGAWLRLRPQPAARIVLCGRVAQDSETFEAARQAARATTVRAFVWNESPEAPETAELVVELGGSEAAVTHDREALTRTFPLFPADPQAIDRLRDGRVQAATTAAIGLRARVSAKQLDAFRQLVVARRFDVSIDVGAGVVTARRNETCAGTTDPAVELLEIRQRAASAGGVLRFEWLPPALAERIDVFGEEPGTQALAASLKQRFDPRRILNPGRFVVGT
ncbi:FAD-binding oxidoreductase, partial [Myxococcota bacterium]|nr:FAD-binding oxidoreductase [Myxococcota bacterium]